MTGDVMYEARVTPGAHPDIHYVHDNFRNLVAGLGVDRDKAHAGSYYLNVISDAVLSAIYRTSWMGKKAVDIPAKDATRKWREWEADSTQITAIENEEKRHRLPQKVRKGIQYSRLYGGGALYFSIKGDDPTLPVDLGTVKKGSLEFVTVFSKSVLTAGEIEQDPMSEYYGMPQWYEVSGGANAAQEIHPSRLVLFTGTETLELEAISVNDGWGDSVLQAAYEAVRNADATAANSASLLYEAKVDVLQIPDLMTIMENPRTRQLLIDRVELCGQLKGNNGMLVIDAEENHEQKSFTFAGIPDIAYQALQAVAAAADIPLTRFLGQSPAGMNSTGEADLKNYYDSVNSMQTLAVTPALYILDEVMLRSALGNRPPEITYTWGSLWQMSDEQKSKISLQIAETIEKLANSGLFHENDLSEAAAILLIEHSILPSFERTQDPEPDPMEDGYVVRDSMPRTLYVHRKVLNASDIVSWARKQGIAQMVPAGDLHITVLYSKEPVGWVDMGEDWSSDENGILRIKPGGARSFEAFGDNAKVLEFSSQELRWRHEHMIEMGASSDYDEYHAHITITYGDVPDGVEPYQGPIVLGPEVFQEIQPGAQDEIEEVEL